MAERRAFTKKIIDSDAFLEMPTSAQALYFHLNMRADDDGFVNSPKRIARLVNASDDDLRLLLAKRFILCFDSGIVVIKHWWMHNTLRKDRYSPTQYQEELALLSLKENHSYTEKRDNLSCDGNQPATNWQPTGNQRLPQYKEIEKNRIEENDMSVSNDTDCRTDVQRILDSWNAIDGIPKVQKLSPDSKRGKSLGARIKEYGVDKVLEAIAEIPESSFLTGKAKKQFKITFDWFVLPNNFPKVLEGNYRDGPKKVYAQDDLFYRTGKTLGNRVSRRLGLPEDTEETRQAYAAEMEACARETGADVGTEIKDAVFFSQSDPFWQSRIVDAKSFRQNFRKILADMRRKDS